MGYCTQYEIQADAPVVERIIELAGYDPFGGEETKWYGHDEHCKQASEEHPEELIVLDGEGEEQGDVWRKFYRAGKVQEHRWYPPSEPGNGPWK